MLDRPYTDSELTLNVSMVLSKVTLGNIKLFRTIVVALGRVVINRVIYMMMMSIRFWIWFSGFQQNRFLHFFIAVSKGPFSGCKFPLIHNIRLGIFINPSVSINLARFCLTLVPIRFRRWYMPEPVRIMLAYSCSCEILYLLTCKIWWLWIHTSSLSWFPSSVSTYEPSLSLKYKVLPMLIE